MTSTMWTIGHHTCPTCGTVTDDPTITMDTDIIYDQPTVPMWDGSPLVADYSQPPEPHVIDQIVTVGACRCQFRTSLWNFRVTTFDDGRPAVVEISPKYGQS